MGGENADRLRGAERQPTGPVTSELDTAGHTVVNILEDVVAREPRYGNATDDGVIHVRPKAAVSDASDVLNQVIARFELDGVTLDQALREVRFALHPELRGGGIMGSSIGPSTLGVRRFSVRVQSTTVCGVLDAIVKAHGAASWSVTYRTEDGRPYAQFTFHAFDGSGITG